MTIDVSGKVTVEVIIPQLGSLLKSLQVSPADKPVDLRTLHDLHVAQERVLSRIQDSSDSVKAEPLAPTAPAAELPQTPAPTAEPAPAPAKKAKTHSDTTEKFTAADFRTLLINARKGGADGLDNDSVKAKMAELGAKTINTLSEEALITMRDWVQSKMGG